MALTPQQTAQQAYDSVTEGAENKVAITLKRQFKNLQLLYKDLALPEDDAEYRRMAGELIDQRKFTAHTKDGGTMEISLADLDKKSDDIGLKGAMGARSLEEAVPTRNQLHRMGQAIGEGVAEQTGTLGFLQGANIVNALIGLVKWMVGGFKDGFGGLKQTIAEVTAEKMQQSVGEKLVALRGERPDMAGVLSNEAINGVNDNVRNTVLKQAGIDTGTSAELTLADVKQETVDSNKLMEARRAIKEKILYPGKESLAEMIAEPYGKGVNGSTLGYLFGPGKKAREKTSQKMADIMADTVSVTVTDPNFRTEDGRKLSELDRDAYADAVVGEVKKSLLAHEKELNFGDGWKKLTDKNKDGVAYVDVLTNGLRDGIANNYDKLSVASRAADQVGEATFAEARNAVDPSLKDGLKVANAEHVQTQLSNLSERRAPLPGGRV